MRLGFEEGISPPEVSPLNPGGYLLIDISLIRIISVEPVTIAFRIESRLR